MPKKTFIFLASIFLTFNGLWAGGWNNTLMGCRALALGGAFVGVADDPSAIFHNPAGLVFQRKRLNFSIDGFHIWPTHEYTMYDGSRIQSKYNSSLPQIFLTYRTSEKLTLGFGFYVPYAGGGVDWKEADLGTPFKSTMGIYTITPTLAYQVSEKFSIGLNLNFYGAVLNVDTKMLPLGPMIIEEMITEERGSAFSAGLGFMFRPTEKARIGLSVRCPARIKLSGNTTITTTVPPIGTVQMERDSETSFNLPWDIEVGFSYRITENFLFATSAQYTMWSALDKVEKTIKDIPLTGDYRVDEEMNFKDILIVRAGVEYFISGGVILRGGIGLDRYATPEEALNIRNIDVDKFTLIGGIGYRTGSAQIDFVYAYAHGKEREKETVGLPFPEKYNLSAVIMGIGVTFSF